MCTVPGAHKDTTWLVAVNHSHWVSASSTVANKGLRCSRVRAHATEFVTVVACTNQQVESALGLSLSLSLSQGGCFAVCTHQALQSALGLTCMLASLSLSPPLNACFNHRRTGHWTNAHQDSGKSLSLSLGRRLEHLQTRHNHNSHTCVGKPLSPLDWAVTHMTTGRPLSLTYRHWAEDCH